MDGGDQVIIQIGQELQPSVNVSDISVQYVDRDKIDDMLEQYKGKLKHEQRGADIFTIMNADNERQRLVDNILGNFSVLLNSVLNNAIHASNRKVTRLPHSEISITPLVASSFNVEPWSAKKRDLISQTATLQEKEKEYRGFVANDLSKLSDSTVGYHLASSINTLLDKRSELGTYERDLLEKIYDKQALILQQIGNSLYLFYSWLLEQWNRKIDALGIKSNSAHRNVDQIFSPTAIPTNLRQLVHQYDTFLLTNNALLPPELQLSDDARKEWRSKMAQCDPVECFRLMQNELNLITATVPALRPAADEWIRKLSQYDVALLQRMITHKDALKRKMKSIIDAETNTSYQERWNNFTHYLYTIGINLQHQIQHKLAQINALYNSKLRMISEKRAQINSLLYGYESRLALVNQPWALWLEKRKYIQKRILDNVMLIVSIDALEKFAAVDASVRDKITKMK